MFACFANQSTRKSSNKTRAATARTHAHRRSQIYSPFKILILTTQDVAASKMVRAKEGEQGKL
jgi:hypothetical protein